MANPAHTEVTIEVMTAADRLLRQRALIDNAARDGHSLNIDDADSFFHGNLSFVPERGDKGFVAYDNAQAVGVVWACFSSAASGFISATIPQLTVHVVQSHRNQGIGRQLITQIVAVGKSAGWPGVSLSVNSANPARGLLQRLGFQALPDNYLRDEPLAEHKDMQLLLHRFVPTINNLAVYCGSAAGDNPHFVTATKQLGQALAAKNIGVVYGGGNIGLMGTIADSVMEAGGRVTGVMTRALVDKEISHEHITRLEIVENMALRKIRMEELADGFIALPGRTGTLEELTQVLTRQQLVAGMGPVVLYNTDGFWTPFYEALTHMSNHGFISRRFIDALIVVDNPDDMFAALDRWISPGLKWLPGHEQ